MSYLYSKTLSIEEVFGKYDTNNDGIIDKNEKESAKELNLFPNFKTICGMTLDKFEKKNFEAYTQYDLSNTYAYNKQQAMIEEAFKQLNEFEEEELEKLEIELKKEEAEMNIRRNGFNLAMDLDIVLTQEQLNLPIDEFMKLIDSIIKDNEQPSLSN